MSKTNVDNVLVTSSVHVTNINRVLKNIKFKIMIDYIQLETTGITIVLNTVDSLSDLQIIENYVKNVENIISENIQALRLLQSKSYLKIIEISYFIDNTDVLINAEFIKSVIKLNHIFNDLSLASRPRVIKTSPKSDIAVV